MYTTAARATRGFYKYIRTVGSNAGTFLTWREALLGLGLFALAVSLFHDLTRPDLAYHLAPNTQYFGSRSYSAMFQMPPYAAVYSVHIMLTSTLVYLATL